jgi:hypothetical protein
MTIFSDILKDSNRGFGFTRSEDWYRAQVRKYLKPPNDIEEGDVLFFTYSPKGQFVLPYWDKYPLVRVLERYGDGFFGVNCHYVNPQIRAGLLKGTIPQAPPKCLHKYLYAHIRGSLRQVPVNEIDGVSILPIEKFYKTVNKTIRPTKKEVIWNL